MYGGGLGYTKMFSRDKFVNFGMNYDFGLSFMSYLPKRNEPWIEGTKIVNTGVGVKMQCLFLSMNYRVGLGIGGDDQYQQKLFQHGFGLGCFILWGKNKF